LRRILLIGMGVVLLTLALSVITASLLASQSELPETVHQPVSVGINRHLARLPGGEIGLLYYDGTGGALNVLFRTSSDTGAVWSPIDTLNAAPYTSLEPPDLQSSAAGELYALWTATDGTHGDTTSSVYFARRDMGTELWTVADTVASATQADVAGARIAVAPDGGLHAVWYDEADSSDIFYSRSTDAGASWRTPVAIDGVDEFVQRPSIAVGPDGKIHVLFEEIIDIAGSGFLSDEILYVLSEDGGDTWSAPGSVSGHGTAQSIAGLAYPNVVVDADTVVHAVWVDDGPDNQDIFHAVKLPDTPWSTPFDVSLSSDRSYYPSIALERGGRLHVLWQENVAGSDQEIYYAWWQDGVWSDPVNFSNTTTDSWAPSLAPEVERAGFLATWLEKDATTPTIYHIQFCLSDEEVWPGDMDQSGTVDAADVIPLAMNLHVTGPARADAEPENWTAHFVHPWVPFEAAHADANGDGVVDVRDLLTIGLRWGSTHDPRFPSAAPPLASIDHAALHDAYLELRRALEGATGAPAASMRDLLDRLIDGDLPAPGGAQEDAGGGRTAALRARALPNPGAGDIRILFENAQAGPVEVAIYDARGRRVRLLEDGWRGAGNHEVSWDGRDDDGRPLPGGVFLARIRASGESLTEKILRLR
jgi:hypothetical protein